MPKAYYHKLVERVDRKVDRLEAQSKRLSLLIESIREKLEVYLGKVQEYKENGKGESLKISKASQRAGNAQEKLDNYAQQVAELNRLISGLRRTRASLLTFNPVQTQAGRGVVRDNYYFPGSKNWNLRNSMFKTYQDLFTPPQFRMKPRRDGAYAGLDYDELDLKHCVVDPELISTGFLAAFDFPVPPENANPLSQLRFKERLIPSVADFFAHSLSPMATIDENGNVTKNYRMLVVGDHTPEHDGKILYTRSMTSKEEGRRPKVASVFDSAYAARRKTFHTDRQYDQELQMITTAEVTAERLHRELLEVIATKNSHGEPRKQEIKAELLKLAEELSGSLTYHKSAAHHDLAKVSALKDSKQRENIPAMCARMLKILRHLKTRTREAGRMAQFQPEDRLTLEREIDRCEGILIRSGDSFERLAAGQGMRWLTHFNELKTISLRPFNLYSQRLYETADSLYKNRSDLMALNDYSIKGIAISRLFDVHRELERLIFLISNTSTQPDTEEVLEMLRSFYQQVRLHHSEEFSSVFNSILFEVVRLGNELKDESGMENNPARRVYLVKNGLKSIDFQALLEQIV